MQLAVQRLVIPRSIRIDLTEQTPEAVNETPCTFNPCFGPRQIALGWAVRQHEPANGVSAILFDNVIRIDDVLLRLGHLLDAAQRRLFARFNDDDLIAAPLPVGRGKPAAIGCLVGLMRHHALSEKAREWPGNITLADVL